MHVSQLTPAVTFVAFIAPTFPGAQRTPLETAAHLEAQADAAEQAGRIDQAFDLYVRAVQALPDPPPIDVDSRLREGLVQLVGRLSSVPPSSNEAQGAAAGGRVEFEQAKDDEGLERAETVFRKAVRSGPWLPDLAFNLALVQEKLYKLEPAAANFKVYLASDPTDADTVRAKLRELEYLIERDRQQTWITWEFRWKGMSRTQEWLIDRERALFRGSPTELSGFAGLQYAVKPGSLKLVLRYGSDEYLYECLDCRGVQDGLRLNPFGQILLRSANEEKMRMKFLRHQRLVRARGETRTVAGVECASETFTVGKRVRIEACLAPRLKMIQSFRRALQRILADNRVVGWHFPREAEELWLLFDQLDSADSFPVFVSFTGLDDDFSMEATKVIQGPIRPALLEEAFKVRQGLGTP